MPASRVALYALSLLSVILAVRSVLGKPLSYSMAFALAGVYATFLALGALRPRMQLFADALASVARDECAIVVRCTESDVEPWLRALSPSGLVVTFSLLEPSDKTLARVRDSAHGVIPRIEQASVRALRTQPKEVNLVDITSKWHTPWFGRALREKNLLWVVPRTEVASSHARLGVAPRDIVAVSGAPNAKVIERWCEEVAEARVTAVALG